METTNKKPIEYLTPKEAAALVGISRIAFLNHVKRGRIAPDNQIGSRGVFSRLLVERFRDWHIQNAGKRERRKVQEVA